MTISTINNGDSGISVRGKLNQAISKLNTYPDTTTDNQIPRFDGAGGGLQGSQIAVSDTGALTGASSVQLTGGTGARVAV